MNPTATIAVVAVLCFVAGFALASLAAAAGKSAYAEGYLKGEHDARMRILDEAEAQRVAECGIGSDARRQELAG